MADLNGMYDEAIAQYEAGDQQGAVAKLQQLLAQDPGFMLAHSALSVYFQRQGNHDAAVEHAQRVCELEPNDPFSYIAMSLVCQKAGRITEAEQASMSARQLQFDGGH